MNIIKRIFSFGRSYDEFELLETEGGQPGFFGSAGRAHKDAAGAIETANDTVASDVSANEERLNGDARGDKSGYGIAALFAVRTDRGAGCVHKRHERPKLSERFYTAAGNTRKGIA